MSPEVYAVLLSNAINDLEGMAKCYKDGERTLWIKRKFKYLKTTLKNAESDIPAFHLTSEIENLLDNAKLAIGERLQRPMEIAFECLHDAGAKELKRLEIVPNPDYLIPTFGESGSKDGGG